MEEILSKFLIDSESPFLYTINIELMLKALPSKIVEYNVYLMMLFKFDAL